VQAEQVHWCKDAGAECTAASARLCTLAPNQTALVFHAPRLNTMALITASVENATVIAT
jgi:hypothetical protein